MSVDASVKQGPCASVGYSRTAKWISILSMIAFIVFTCGIHTAIAKESNIDFSKSQYFLALDQCPHPEPGWVYVKIAGVDLRMPYDPSIGLWGYKYRTPVGDKGMEGCRGHPAPLQTLFLYPYRDQLLADWPASARKALTGFELRISSLPRWPQSDLEKMLSILRSKGECRNLRQGLVKCSALPIRSTDAIIFKISKSIYETPNKGRFIVGCGVPGLTWGFRNDECVVVYFIRSPLYLQYKFNRAEVDISRIVELDRSVRESVQGMVVRN